MRPQLINFQMVKNAQYRIEKAKLIIRKKNNQYTNLFIIIVIILFSYFLYYRYLNKNLSIKKKKNEKEQFSNQLFSYYNQMKKNDLMEILNGELKNK